MINSNIQKILLGTETNWKQTGKRNVHVFVHMFIHMCLCDKVFSRWYEITIRDSNNFLT